MQELDVLSNCVLSTLRVELCCAGLSDEKKAQLLEKLVGEDSGECPICMDGAQEPVISLCCHGPFCRECITTSLQHQVGTAPMPACIGTFGCSQIKWLGCLCPR